MVKVLTIRIAAVAVLGAVAISAPAQAFTFSNGDSTSGGRSGLQADGLPVYTDPAHKLEDPGNGKSTFQFGGGTVTVGPQRSFESDYYSSRNRILSPSDRDR